MIAGHVELRYHRQDAVRQGFQLFHAGQGERIVAGAPAVAVRDFDGLEGAAVDDGPGLLEQVFGNRQAVAFQLPQGADVFEVFQVDQFDVDFVFLDNGFQEFQVLQPVQLFEAQGSEVQVSEIREAEGAVKPKLRKLSGLQRGPVGNPRAAEDFQGFQLAGGDHVLDSM